MPAFGKLFPFLVARRARKRRRRRPRAATRRVTIAGKTYTVREPARRR